MFHETKFLVYNVFYINLQNIRNLANILLLISGNMLFLWKFCEFSAKLREITGTKFHEINFNFTWNLVFRKIEIYIFESTLYGTHNLLKNNIFKNKELVFLISYLLYSPSISAENMPTVYLGDLPDIQNSVYSLTTVQTRTNNIIEINLFNSCDKCMDVRCKSYFWNKKHTIFQLKLHKIHDIFWISKICYSFSPTCT
jgi:hypothetical protein